MADKVFKMPNAVKISGRVSSITNSFINGIIPCISPSDSDISEALEVLGMDATTICCSYCGDRYTEWDHFRPLIEGKKATGYISEIQNLVPSCGKCNQSKGNRHWRDWITGPASLSPTSRKVPHLETRIAYLAEFENWRPPTRIDFAEIVGLQLWDEYSRTRDELEVTMQQAQELSSRVKTALARALE